MGKIRWGILSTARINRRVIPALKASAQNELVAVASRNLEHARAYAHEWKIPVAYGSYGELLNDPNIDVIYISLPNHLHAEWTIKAAQAGKHVLCEKPLALNVADVDRISAAAAAGGVTVMEAFMYRHHPMTLKVRELVETGAIGDVRYLRATFTFILDATSTNIRWQPESGGGSLWDIGCYPVSYARLIMGCLPAEVCGAQVLGDSGIDVSFTGQIRFPNGAFAQVESSFELPSYTSVEIRGTQGTILVPVPFNPSQERTQITLIQADKQRELHFDYPLLYKGEVEDMAAAITTHKPPRLSLAESREIIAILTALYQSALENRPIRFEPHAV
jgi:D-xylose 1-dehydrogenase (NADP+, D-xylono-1,5-lactone-forming)